MVEYICTHSNTCCVYGHKHTCLAAAAAVAVAQHFSSNNTSTYINKQTNVHASHSHRRNSTLKQRQRETQHHTQNNRLHTLFSMLPHWLVWLWLWSCLSCVRVRVRVHFVHWKYLEGLLGVVCGAHMTVRYTPRELGVFNMASVWMCCPCLCVRVFWHVRGRR